jgi:hypothetical protein
MSFLSEVTSCSTFYEEVGEKKMLSTAFIVIPYV